MRNTTNRDVEKKLKFLFDPDVLLPAQYFERNKKKIEATPEKALMLAILEDAVYCFQKYVLIPDRRAKILFEEAKRWIFDDDERGVFSYRNACEIVGIDAGYLRLGLLRWKELRLASRVYKVKRKHRLQGV